MRDASYPLPDGGSVNPGRCFIWGFSGDSKLSIAYLVFSGKLGGVRTGQSKVWLVWLIADGNSWLKFRLGVIGLGNV